MFFHPVAGIHYEINVAPLLQGLRNTIALANDVIEEFGPGIGCKEENIEFEIGIDALDFLYGIQGLESIVKTLLRKADNKAEGCSDAMTR